MHASTAEEAISLRSKFHMHLFTRERILHKAQSYSSIKCIVHCYKCGQQRTATRGEQWQNAKEKYRD